MKFVPALACLFCLALLGTCLVESACLISEPCILDCKNLSLHGSIWLLVQNQTGPISESEPLRGLDCTKIRTKIASSFVRPKIRNTPAFESVFFVAVLLLFWQSDDGARAGRRGWRKNPLINRCASASPTSDPINSKKRFHFVLG